MRENRKDKSNIKRELTASFYQNNHLRWLLTMILTVLEVPVQLTIAWILGAMIDAIAVGELSGLWNLLGWMTAFVAGFLVWGLALERLRAAFIHRALEQYKSLAFQRLSEKSISAFARENTGRYISVLTNDVGTIEEKYLFNSFRIICQILLFLGALVMMLVYSPALTAASIGFSVLPFAVAILTGGSLVGREQLVSDRNEAFVARVKDLFGGFAVIKSFKAEKEAAERFDDANHAAEAAKRDRRWWGGFVETVATASGTIMQFGVFFVGAYLAIRGDITAGTVIVFVQMGNNLIGPVQTIPQYYAGLRAARGLIEKLARLAEENAGRSGETVEPILRDAIELRDLSFSYEPDKPVLEHLSLRLEAGKKYALVGDSGSGKSTLLNLLMGAYDSYEGSLAIDGRELKNIAPDSLYDLISLVGQNVFLFDDTLQRNTTMFREFPRQQVDSAWERSGLGELVAEKGADYSCGENGCNLSGGERQRVSIARCLLRETPVLLLDEVTAALDSQTAFAVTDSILSLDGLTWLVVTHRLEPALLERYDGIFVLRNGRLWGSGQFRELMEQKGYFYSLYTVANA